MATAMRSMAAKLKQKFPVPVQRLFASSQARETPKPSPTIGSIDIPEFRRLDELVKLNQKNYRNANLRCLAGVGLGWVVFELSIYRLKRGRVDLLDK